MNKKIKSALISVFYKDGLETLVRTLHTLEIKIYTTGGTQQFIENLGIPCVAVESVTDYPSILGGRVKTLHPKIFGGILGRRGLQQDMAEMEQYGIPEIDLVIVDLYPFEETLASTNEESLIIEKIDIGGPSMIRAAAKNFSDLTVLASKDDYAALNHMLLTQEGHTTLAQRKQFAGRAFEVVKHYDIAISDYFNNSTIDLRYGENPHQQASFKGNPGRVFEQLHGKELSYNNMVDTDAALQLLHEFSGSQDAFFAIIKHTNVCGAALSTGLPEAWERALAGDPESAFGGVLLCNGIITNEVAKAINEIFFEVLIADGFEADALETLQTKKNRILLKNLHSEQGKKMEKTVLNGLLSQDTDQGNFETWNEAGGRESTENEREDLRFANLLCKHLKSNAIALVKNRQMTGKGCGQTSRIDALKHAISKSEQFQFDLQGAVLASDAFFPFDDCVRIAHAAGITAFIQPGGSIRDKDSVQYCVDNKLAMVLTGQRHFRH